MGGGILEVEEVEEPGWNWSEGGGVLVDVLLDMDWLLDVDWLCPEGDNGEVCGGQVTEESTTRLPWSSKMPLAILQKLFSTTATGFKSTDTLSISEKLSALVHTKYQVNVVYRIIGMVHGSLIMSSGTPVAMSRAQKQVNLCNVRQLV